MALRRVVLIAKSEQLEHSPPSYYISTMENRSSKLVRAFSRAFLITLVLCGQWGAGGFCCCGIRSILAASELPEFSGSPDSWMSLGDRAASKQSATFRCPKCVASKFLQGLRDSNSEDRLSGSDCQCRNRPCVAFGTESNEFAKIRCTSTISCLTPWVNGFTDARQVPHSSRLAVTHFLSPSCRWQARACIWRI
jgi:hypothetical protein